MSAAELAILRHDLAWLKANKPIRSFVAIEGFAKAERACHMAIAESERNADLLEAARQAVRTIRCWHSIQIGIAGQPELEEEVWELYQQSPEMKKINAAIERAEKGSTR